MKKIVVLLALSFTFFCFGGIKPEPQIAPVTYCYFHMKTDTCTEMLSQQFVLGKFDYKSHERFTKVNPEHSTKPIYIQSEVYYAFKRMCAAAKANGVQLVIISGTRNFNEQKAIWERKWTKYNYLQPLNRANKILEYSSMPSTSRHHWGTDIDLNQLTNSYFETGKGKKEYDWLVQNANSFGFYQVYTNKENGRTGYNLEKWHWSYLPLATDYLKFYNASINYDLITGFEGYHLAMAINVINNYVNGIANIAKLRTKN